MIGVIVAVAGTLLLIAAGTRRRPAAPMRRYVATVAAQSGHATCSSPRTHATMKADA